MEKAFGLGSGNDKSNTRTERKASENNGTTGTFQYKKISRKHSAIS
jgi:hypothetical protein